MERAYAQVQIVIVMRVQRSFKVEEHVSCLKIKFKDTKQVSKNFHIYLKTLYIFQIYVPKYQMVKVHCDFNCWIFDGPTIHSQNVTERLMDGEVLVFFSSYSCCFHG